MGVKRRMSVRVAVLVVPALLGMAGPQLGQVVAAAPGDPAAEVPVSAPAAVDGSIVQFALGVGRDAAAAALSEHGVTASKWIDGSRVVAVVDRPVSELGALAGDARVGVVEANVALVDPSDGAATGDAVDAVGVADAAGEAAVQKTAPWNLDRLDQSALPLDLGYDTAYAGRGVTAYVIDSGIRSTHVEFGGRVVAGYSVYGDDGRTDCRSHGTHVAATIGGATSGVAKQVTIVPVRASQCDGLYFNSDLIDSFAWVRSHHQAGVPAVLNMSVAGSISATLDQAVRDTVADGVVVVLAAGNDGGSACSLSPSREPLAITVAAVDDADVAPSWSNDGPCVDIFAPGVDIVAATNTSNTAFESKDGTSMAAPHVAGAAALILEREPTLTPAQVASRLIDLSITGVVGNAGAGSPNRLLHVPSNGYVPLTPARLMDTRPDGVTVDGVAQRDGIRTGGAITPLQITGRGGVPTSAGAVALNVTAVGGPLPGFLTVFPCGGTPPNSSNLNFAANGVIPNAVVSKTDAQGRVCLFSNVSTHVIVDVNGYFPSGSSYVGLTPARLMDTRAGTATVDGQAAGGGTRAAGQVTELVVAGRGGVPADAEAAVLNVTAVAGRNPGFVTVYPCGSPQPNSSNLNFAANGTIPNAVFATIGTAGTVCLFTNANTDLIVDVGGYFPGGSSYVPMNPARLMDTRTDGVTIDGQSSKIGLRSAGQVTELVVEGRAGVPVAATGVVLNVTVTGPTSPGYVTVLPCGESVPNSSNLNFAAAQTIPNAVVAKIGTGGKVCLFSQVPLHLVVDVGGYLVE